LHAELKHAFGIDLSQIPGIRAGNARALFGEIGPHVTKFRSPSTFASWIGLCPDPDNEISGGRFYGLGRAR
jgi:transposase